METPLRHNHNIAISKTYITCVFLQMFFAALLITLKRPLSSGQIITDNDRGVKNIAIGSVAECHFVNE